MILKRFYDDQLAQASYLVGCSATGEALVVDPNRDAEQYSGAAEAEGLRISHITETHIHADFVSGARELAARTGGKLYLSDEGDENWKYRFADEADAVLLKDGDTFEVGNVRIDVVHTPGHTPEHVAFVVTDTAGADRPMGVFTGDFIFVGDVGRPDLLEKAAKHTGSMEQGARALHASLQKFKVALPEYVQLWPGHGAGSACGKALGAVPQTTLGYEKLFNWGLATSDRDEFVRTVLAGQPEPPMYFAEMKRINQQGPRVLGGFPQPELVPAERLREVLERDAVVVDTRSGADFAAAHVPRTISVPLGRSFTTWAGSVLPYDRDFYLIVEDTSGRTANQAARDLAMVGLDRIQGYFDAGAVGRWSGNNGAAEDVPEVTADQLSRLLAAEGVELIDVRNGSEWESGHIAGSRNLPLGRLPEVLDQIPRDKPLVVHCQSGARAGVAVSLLQANGFADVSHLTGDFAQWSKERRPVETGHGAER